ncbi:uncharacterized protein M437DRAFT_40381 [Aureobasidium melanogenum CBS 110374]|uniref:Uncharacterized protein n=1 Tax=Aureobasidium melanogenum (strain CBS 110374) TaxID=1043003 RepID=A0A074VZ38_AURM1|nr:uncharacterized protein M437DRAFT_40381 [Aureobasidium melanogenum CBS 110374]KEQ66080.1 hypothetical protein M437DRAFT_40381 [Aureobasidium melanogenum CBS 110374]
MPARQQSSSSEIALSSSPTSPNPRSSLRRLSSLANLHQFNPFNSFNRRRSSHSTQNSDEDPYLLSTYQQRPQNQQSRQTYVPLSDEPLPALPKSRTFSNLPRTRARNNSKPPVSLKPPSRIPTPTMSSSAKSRLASATKSILKVSNRRVLVRSDTEPLLVSNYSHEIPTSTNVHKENDPINVYTSDPTINRIELPQVPLYPLELEVKTFNPVKRLQTPVNRIPKPPPRRDSLQQSTSCTPSTKKPCPKVPKTPVTVISKPRRQTMLAPEAVPLHSVHDKGKYRSSFSSDIQFCQLLTPRAAPTHSPSSCPRPSATCLRPDDSTSNINMASDFVTSAQSTAYWSGRLMSQFDRRRNEELQALLSRTELGPAYPENDLNTCLRELQKKCVTEDARLSFAMFKARVYVKAGTLGTTVGVVETGIESRGKHMVKA